MRLPLARAAAALLAIALTGALSPLGAFAQATEPPPDSAPAPPPAPDTASVVVQHMPGGTMVAVSIRYPVGSAMDPPGEEGTAFLAGRAIETEAARRLVQHGARIEVDVGPHETLVTLLAPPEQWVDALATTESLLAGPLPSGNGEIEELRARHLERLVFEEGAPVRTFEIERMRLVLGTADPGARAVSGTRASIEAVPPDGPARFVDRHLDRAGATVAVVGPVSEAELARALPGPRLQVTTSGPADDDSVVPPAGPASSDGSASATSLAWESPDRVTIDRELTSAWLAVAWPFPADTPRALLDILAGTLRDAAVPSPPGPGFYGAETAVQETGRGPVVVFSVTAHPDAASRWDRRVQEAMPGLSTSPPEGAFFDLGRRRHRNRMLLATSTPDGRSRELARRLARGEDLGDAEAWLRELTPDDLAGLAGAAGPPRVLVFGPLEMIGESP